MVGIPFTFEAILSSALLQAVYSVIWSLIALVLKVVANQRRQKSIWHAGALVLALTILKLFVVDLAGTGTLARIVSFIGVGLLILVIAFFAPMPPGHGGDDHKPGDVLTA